MVPGSTTNYGSATTINVAGGNTVKALVQFDLSTLPAGTGAGNVAKATLALFVNKVVAAGTVNISVSVPNPAGAWTESTVICYQGVRKITIRKTPTVAGQGPAGTVPAPRAACAYAPRLPGASLRRTEVFPKARWIHLVDAIGDRHLSGLHAL